MDHVIAGLQIGQVGRERRQLRFAGGRLRDQIGSVEKIFRAEDGDARFRKHDAPAHASLYQQSAGGRARNVGPLGQIGARGIGRVEAELEGNRVLLENVGQALQFADRLREEDHAVALLHQIARFGDGGLDVAVKSERRPGIESTRRELRPTEPRCDELQFAEGQFGMRLETRAKLRPSERNSLPAGRETAGRFLPGASTGVRRRSQSVPARRERSAVFPPARIANACAGAPAEPEIPSPETDRRGSATSICSDISRSNSRDFGYSTSGSSVVSAIFITRALRLHVEAADGFDQIAEQLDADGLGGFGRENVQDAAAQRVFADHLHRLALFVADAFQVRQQVFQRNLFADP